MNIKDNTSHKFTAASPSPMSNKTSSTVTPSPKQSNILPPSTTPSDQPSDIPPPTINLSDNTNSIQQLDDNTLKKSSSLPISK